MCSSSNVTLLTRVTSAVIGAGLNASKWVASAITLVSAVGPTAAVGVHIIFPCLKHRDVRIVYVRLRAEEGEEILQGSRAPARAVFSRATVLTQVIFTAFQPGGTCPLQGGVSTSISRY